MISLDARRKYAADIGDQQVDREAPRLLDVMRQKIRARHYSLRTEKAYIHWVRRFIRFHQRRHPRILGRREIEGFLTHLAVERRVAASTQNQALSAILFLYHVVLEIKLPWLEEVVRAKRPQRLPVVLTRHEAQQVIARLSGASWLIVSLLYGAGLRVSEALRLRVKDVDFEYRQIIVRDGKGQKDRVSVLPDALHSQLRAQLAKLQQWLDAQPASARVPASMPHAIKRKYPRAALSWQWQYIFPSASTCRDPLTPLAHATDRKCLDRRATRVTALVQCRNRHAWCHSACAHCHGEHPVVRRRTSVVTFRVRARSLRTRVRSKHVPVMPLQRMCAAHDFHQPISGLRNVWFSHRV
jgi:integron integrase